MHSHKDIENKSIFVINGTKNQCFKVQNGFLCLYNSETGKNITKLPFPKMLCILIIGHTTLTTAFIEHANKHGVPVSVMKPNFRPVYFFGTMAEANYLLRKRQHHRDKKDLSIAKNLVLNKILNQRALLKKTKKNNKPILKYLAAYEKSILYIQSCNTLSRLMAAEGRMASYFFKAYYDQLNWQKRIPRCKPDSLNALLDIGYTFLFHFVESNCRFFGFDLYIGVYHQLWFRRKSLVCDMVEPFRCIIDRAIYNGIKSGKINLEDFEKSKNSYYLKHGKRSHYTQFFFDAIIPYKLDVFKYVQAYYRAFMQEKGIAEYPKFEI